MVLLYALNRSAFHSGQSSLRLTLFAKRCLCVAGILWRKPLKRQRQKKKEKVPLFCKGTRVVHQGKREVCGKLVLREGRERGKLEGRTFVSHPAYKLGIEHLRHFLIDQMEDISPPSFGAQKQRNP